MNSHPKIIIVVMTTLLMMISSSLANPFVPLAESSQSPAATESKKANPFYTKSATQVAQHFERQQKQILELERELKDIQLASGLLGSDSCGGHVLLPNQAVLSYKDPRPQTAGPPTPQKCVWIVLAANSGPIGYTLMDYNFGENFPAPEKRFGDSTSLRFQVSLGMMNSSEEISITPLDQEVESLVGSSCAALVFTSYPGQSFSLRLRGQGLIATHKVINLNSIFLHPEPQNRKVYAYPPGAASSDSHTFTGYSRLENRIIVLQALPGQRIQISLDFLDTEATHDTLTIQEFSSTLDKFLFRQRFSGPMGEVKGVNLVANDNEPMLLFFQTDLSVQGRGFKISYSYIPA